MNKQRQDANTTPAPEDDWFAINARMSCWYEEVMAVGGNLLPPFFRENEY